MLDILSLMAFVGYSVTMASIGIRIGIYIAKNNRRNLPK